MFITSLKFKKRVLELADKRYFGMTGIAPFTSYEDTADVDEVRNTIPQELFNSNSEITIGDQFTGRDRYLWIYKNITMPTAKQGCKVVGLFDFGKSDQGSTHGFESLLYVNRNPYQAVDINHQDVVFDDFAGSEAELVFMLWTGLEGGGIPKEQIHRISRAEVGYLHIATDKLYYYAKAISESLEILEADDPNRNRLIDILDSALLKLNWDEDKFYDSAQVALECLEQKIAQYGKFSDITVNCIGHTHIDMAWLWRLKHSREKGQRSFSTVNRLMNEYDEYKFLQTQPQLYKNIKNDSPQIYNMIKNRIKEGKWEVDGGMWLEADCNISSGESLVRQLTHGIKFIRDEFGKECEYLWLPDVFGYSWALPQILNQCNIKTFMTTKISWNQYNTMPNDLFKWRGIDGSEVLTYFITVPADNEEINSRFSTYNGLMNPHSVIGSWKKFRNKDLINETLIAYGYGDGGGGVNREMLEMRRVMDKLPGLPNVKTTKAGEFFDRLHESTDNTDKYVPIWDGELYLEYHRGTYTSQAKNKKFNRELEIKLAESEWLSSIALLHGAKYPLSQINDCWETVLCNQFHDIIPGSSIHEVYEDSTKSYTEADCALSDVENNAFATIVKPQNDSYSAFSFCSFSGKNFVFIETEKTGVFEDLLGNILPSQQTEGGYIVEIKTKSLSSAGFKFVECKNTFVTPFINSPYFIESPFYIVKWNENGALTSVFDKENNREVLKGTGNEFEIYEDMPCNFDAWDIDIFYTWKRESAKLVKFEAIETGNVRQVIRFTYRYNLSTIEQDMILYASSRRIDFETRVDWHESHRLLKSAFNVDVRSTKATYDIQFGHAERPTHFNTSWDYARFEVVGHKWMDISDDNYGVSILNNCKYGYSAHNNKISITLLKSAKEPDYAADMGEHSFTYSLLPHTGTVTKDDTIKEANLLNMPPVITNGICTDLGRQLFKTNSDAVIIDAVKQAENGNGIVIRLHECLGGKQDVEITSDYGFKSYTPCNLLEEKMGDTVNSDTVHDVFEPFSIHTYIIEF